jgi:hypothetical protein
MNSKKQILIRDIKRVDAFTKVLDAVEKETSLQKDKNDRNKTNITTKQ